MPYIMWREGGPWERGVPVICKWTRGALEAKRLRTAVRRCSRSVCFVAGDLFDEGKWCNDREFNYHMARFSKMFRRGLHNNMHILVGNHDVGFHSM